jgi:hypothetical protein
MQTVDQTVNGGCCILIGDVGQAGITCGSSGAGVAEQALNVTQAQALFE